MKQKLINNSSHSI